MGTFRAEDTIGGSIGSLDKGLRCYMSYVDNLGGFSELVKTHSDPGVLLVPITVNGNRAKCADFESGGMVASQAPGWLDHLAEPDPWLYTFASNAQNLYDNAGRRSFRKWQAHTGQGEHLCGQAGRGWPRNPGCQYPDADITQWVFSPGGRDIDISTGLTYLLPGPPTPVDPLGYRRFTNDPYHTPFGVMRERDIVEKYDGARKHPRLRSYRLRVLQPELDWLADRVRAEAYRQPSGWQGADRSWRYVQLIRRSQGQQFAH